MRCVLGIGNPGEQYAGTRHNAGFLVLDELARRHRLGAWHKRWSSLIADWRPDAAIGEGRVVLVKPQTFVNASGEAAQAVCAFHKIPPEHLLVVVDDLNLPLGSLRLRAAGSAGGHNGLRDIEARLGPAYPRLRLGIGAPAGDQIGHVLGSFAESERADAAAMIAKAADCVESWLREGVVVACRFNGPLRPPPARVKPGDAVDQPPSSMPP